MNRNRVVAGSVLVLAKDGRSGLHNFAKLEYDMFCSSKFSSLEFKNLYLSNILNKLKFQGKISDALALFS
jgi:hypothetical protein